MIYVLGASGQLGQEFKKHEAFKEACFLSREQVDLSNLSQLQNFLENTKIKTIINAAAYTQVDKAESERELAQIVNSEAVKLLGQYSQKKRFKFVHYSTDYVFSGTSFRPYKESDPTSPVNFYGQSKLLGEEFLKGEAPNSLIFRTSWVYAGHGKNFFNTILRLASSREEISVVADQVGTPTWAPDLVHVTAKALASDLEGVFHFSNEGVASWYDFAHEIVKINNLKTRIAPITTELYPTPAVRPFYSVLDKEKLRKALGVSLPYWRDSLEACIKGLKI